MRIIITGTKGFIGGQLKKELTDKNNIFEINEDLFQINNWQNNLKNELEDISPDIIFHVGACSNTLETDVSYIMSRNYESTKIISDFCSYEDIPLVYSSSAAVYGIDNKLPSNLYGWSKYVGENYVTQNGGVALRYFNVYGPNEQNKGTMSSMIYQIMSKHLNGEKIRLFPKNPRRDFIYINDVISANLHAMNNYDEYHFNYYDVGTGYSYLFEDILYCLNIENFEYTSEEEIPNGYQFTTKANREKMMSGWSAKFDLESGIKQYVSSFIGAEHL